MKFHEERLKKIKEKIKDKKFDAFFTADCQNIKYLTGFSSLEGILLIAKEETVFFTSFCEFEEAKLQISSARIKERKRSDWRFLKDYTARKKIKKLGFEENHFSLTNLKAIKKCLLNCQLKAAVNLIEELRAIKDSREIVKITKAIAITEKIFGQIKHILKEGVTEREILQGVNVRIAKEGCQPAFNPIVAVAGHSAFPHAEAGSKALKKNDLILIDMGVDFEGYKSDLTRLFTLGRLDSKKKEIYNLVLEAQNFLYRLIKPGLSISALEKKSHWFFAQKGWDKFFPHSLGHGIGLEVHEMPFFSKKTKGKLISGMVFTLEPALYFPGWGGVRIEDVYLVTQQGAQKLSCLSAQPELN